LKDEGQVIAKCAPGLTAPAFIVSSTSFRYCTLQRAQSSEKQHKEHRFRRMAVATPDPLTKIRTFLAEKPAEVT
jgi:hypothetical protein